METGLSSLRRKHAGERLPVRQSLYYYRGLFVTRTIRVKVNARRAKSELAGELADGTLKINIAAPPEKGKANEELCRFLASRYGIARSEVRIVSGHNAALKLVGCP